VGPKPVLWLGTAQLGCNEPLYFSRHRFAVVKIIVVLVELPRVVEGGRRQFKSLPFGELVNTDELIDVLVLYDHCEAEVGATGLPEHPQAGHFGVVAVFLATNRVARNLFALYREAYFDVWKFFYDGNQTLGMEPI